MAGQRMPAVGKDEESVPGGVHIGRLPVEIEPLTRQDAYTFLEKAKSHSLEFYPLFLSR